MRLSTRIRGLYGIADAQASGGDPERLAVAMLAGGCRLVQLRAKGWDLDDTERVGRRIASRCRIAGATFILNDHPELAVALDADGVHIGQLDGDIEAARQIVGPRRIIGRSTHDPEQVLRALTGADYLAFGPVFPTPNLSRPKLVRGPERLADTVRAVRGRVPVVAIGGIGPAEIPAVLATGAQAWAVIGAIASASDPVVATRALCNPSEPTRFR